MRRLPVYLLLDTSGSMTGEPIESVRNGLQMLVAALRGEPQALETAYLSVITFDTDAKQVVPLTDLVSFQEPTLNAGGVTALGEALELVCSKIDSEVTKTTLEQRGDWKPLVFMLTDGQPTDDWQKGAEQLKKKKLFVVACAAGFDADTKVLKGITENVLELKSTSAADLAAFFKWVTGSIVTGSQKVETGKGEVAEMDQFPLPPKEINVVP
ncbi:VWA domain-containing protein [bacterium]|nr:VWA domain-containing protein [bacterium]